MAELLIGKVGDLFVWWQFVLLAVLVVLIIFWVMYRKRQM